MNRVQRDHFARETARLLIGDRQDFLPGRQQAQLDLLGHQRLLALFGSRLENNPELRGQLSIADLKRIRHATSELVAEHCRAREVLENALEQLSGFEPLLFKGLAAAEGWPGSATRPPGDIDLLVSPERHTEAVSRLQSAGWTVLPTVHSHLDEATAARYGFATMLQHPRWPVALDLHRQLVDKTEPFTIDFQEFGAESTSRGLGEGVTARVPSPGRHLAFMALHAVRYGVFRWMNFLDIFFWVARMSIKDNIDIFEFSRTNSILRPVRVAFLAAEALFGRMLCPVEMSEATNEERAAASRRGPWILARGHMDGWLALRRLHAKLDLLSSRQQRRDYSRAVLFPEPELIGRSGRKPHPMHYLIFRIRAAMRLLRSFRRFSKDS